jgi:hypothetical protein
MGRGKIEPVVSRSCRESSGPEGLAAYEFGLGRYLISKKRN